MRVMKFGAANLSDETRLRQIVQVVLDAHTALPEVVVVCTALPGITDALIDAARGREIAVENARRELWGRHRALAEKLVTDSWEREELYRDWAELLRQFDRVTRAIVTLGEPSPRATDLIASLGERFATHLVAVVLRQSRVAAQRLDATELILTDDHFGNARPDPALSTERLRQRVGPMIRAGIVPVLAGYIGATRSGLPTTLGRGGGDYTAALIASALGAREVVIWTDVDGIMTADPQLVTTARTLPQLSYTEAAEIAHFAPDVLHPRTIGPVERAAIPVRIANLLAPERPGTLVVAKPEPVAAQALAIISTRGLCLLTLAAASSEAWALHLAARALDTLLQSGVEVSTFVQTLSERSLSVAVRLSDAEFASERLRATFAHEVEGRTISEINISPPVALLGVLSADRDRDLSTLVLGALAAAETPVLGLLRGTSAGHLSVVIPDRAVERTVAALHDALRLA